MIWTPLKAFLLVVGATVVAAGVAYYSGALDRFLSVPPAQIASLPDSAADTKTDRVETPAAPAAGLPAPDAPVPAAGAPAAVEPTAPSSPSAMEPAAPAAPTAEGSVIPPAFDLVRVESDGSIVIAGEAAPGATVEILTGSKVLGQTTAAPQGDFAVVLDDRLEPGDYQIVLRATTGANVIAMSPETAIVSVPESVDGQVLALVEQPGQPSKLITVPEPAGPAMTGGPATPAEPAAVPDATTEPDASAAPSVVATEPPSQLAPAVPKPAEGPVIKVEAVEIEGNRIFVAGVADANRLVRVYANDILLGESKASEGGRFLVEALRELPVGGYIIRADLIAPDGIKVVARAAVPFEREAGQTVAAIAPQTAVPVPVDPAPSAAALAPATSATASAPAPSEPTATQLADANAAAASANATSGGANVAAGGAAGTDAAAAAAPATGPAQSAPTATPAEASASEQPLAAAQPPVSAQPPASASSAQAGATASATVEVPAPAVTLSDGPPAITAPKLQSVDSAVIIRRGDTLWRISRRVYGMGVRYSTIYLANQDQISDPDRIWPGQVFKVPEKTGEGEAADMDAVADQTAAQTGAATSN